MSLLQGKIPIGAALAATALVLGGQPAAAGAPGKEKRLDDYPAVQKAARTSAKKEGVSLLINLSGEPCAKVLSAKHVRGDSFEVACQENRSGVGTARYLFDAAKGSAVRSR